MSTTDAPSVVVHRFDPDSPGDGVTALLTAYHLRTEAEKGVPVDDVAALPARYLAEIVDPSSAFAGDTVLVARHGNAAVGCLVVTAPVAGRAELKRLWTDPELRGRGMASRLIGTALTGLADGGAHTAALSVWRWRTGAIALYEGLGFAVVDPWDERADLVCMERVL
ncbi:GNAT family N-acetyltransferase [Promicromonospora kroppenstedtii]|uniref:GNAT family N-acetyltransferase n=1 Tax=Promicromonospora kroppenstedtii TaxID=440482 RepID=A0ABW7XE26_9MICO